MVLYIKYNTSRSLGGIHITYFQPIQNRLPYIILCTRVIIHMSITVTGLRRAVLGSGERGGEGECQCRKSWWDLKLLLAHIQTRRLLVISYWLGLKKSNDYGVLGLASTRRVTYIKRADNFGKLSWNLFYTKHPQEIRNQKSETRKSENMERKQSTPPLAIYDFKDLIDSTVPKIASLIAYQTVIIFIERELKFYTANCGGI